MSHHPPADERPHPRRRALQLAAPRVRARRSRWSLAGSLAAHAVVLWVVGQALEVPAYLDSLLERSRPPAPERLTWVEPAVGGGGAPGGLPVPEPPAPAERPRTPVAPQRPAAPTVTPTGIEPASPATEPVAPGGAAAGSGDGTGVGRPGPAAGLQPTYTESPVWRAPEAPRELPSVAGRVEEMIAEDFASLRDSAAAEAAKRRPGDWTFERDGRKYGMDEQFIHLGRLSIPTPLLGLLNFSNVQANPIQAQRARSLSGMMRESREQGLRAQNDKDFRDVVRDIRERKDRERAERMAREAELRRQAGEPPPSPR